MHPLLARLSRTSRLFPLLALAACVNQAPGMRYGAAPLNAAGAPAAAGGAKHVAILLPLTGPNAELGQALLKAAKLSLDQPGAPTLDQQDTQGTPEGAATAARAAVAANDGLILGPLTAAETAAVAPVARAANIPVLAFTSDAAQAQPGIWVLGITPAQQVRRLVLAVKAEDKTRLSAILPPNIFGDALVSGLTTAAAEAGMPEPRIIRAPATFAGTNDALKTISDYATRRGAIDSQVRAARAQSTPDARQQAAEIGKQDVPPPPMDALLLAATGDLLGQTVPLLSFYDIPPTQVRILGPALWARDAPRQPGLAGAWYAAPDTGARAGFEQAYTAKYQAPPRDFASLAFDAAGIARAAAAGAGFSAAALTRPDGYAGADGLLALLPDGHVRRGLAIFEIDRTGAHIVQPAPQTFSAPGKLSAINARPPAAPDRLSPGGASGSGIVGASGGRRARPRAGTTRRGHRPGRSLGHRPAVGARSRAGNLGPPSGRPRGSPGPCKNGIARPSYPRQPTWPVKPSVYPGHYKRGNQRSRAACAASKP